MNINWIDIGKDRIAAGETVDAVVSELLESGCSPEEATQLRALFAPSVETVVPPSPSERSVPALQIDWGTDLKPGRSLVPKFTIKNVQRPLVYLKISQINLQQIPKELKKIGNDRYFYQPLRLDEPGQYLCQIILIDQAPGFADPGYYHADFRIDVTDPKEAGQRRKVTIHADGNFVGNFDRFRKDADLEIVSGGNVTLMARDESVVDKMAAGNDCAETENEAATIPFLSDTDAARRVPYISVTASEKVHRLTMTESGAKRFVFVGGQRLVFGRDVPEENAAGNDVPLEVRPGTPDEQNLVNDFAVLNKLFSREHAHLQVRDNGVHLADVRKGGILDATMLDGKALPRGGSARLLFANDDPSPPRTVLFSKVLAMKLAAHYGGFLEKTLLDNLPEDFPEELLTDLYSVVPFTGISSVSVKPERCFQQEPHAATLLYIVKSTPLAESDWWKQWFSSTSNVNPEHDRYEYWFVPRFVTIGRDDHHAIRLEHRQWKNTQLRIVYINDSLYLENISLGGGVEYGIGDTRCPLAPFRPQPLCVGAFVRKDNAVLQFE